MNIDYDYLSRIRRAVSMYTKRKTSNILDGDFHSIYKGRSMEFEDLKEYAYGDDVHDIDWKASSRMSQILVRRYMVERRHNVMFICDRGEKMLGDTSKGEAKKELMLMTFGSLAYIVGRNGADYALSYANEHSAEKSFFRSGSDHLESLLYDYEKKCTVNSPYSLTKTVEEILNTVHKRMIIFVITDMEGLSELREGLIKSATTKHDLFIINIDDAFLTGDTVFDNELGLYEKIFLSHSKALHQEEVRLRQEILSNASLICKRNRAAMMTIASESEIIERTIAMIERYKNGYYG